MVETYTVCLQVRAATPMQACYEAFLAQRKLNPEFKGAAITVTDEAGVTHEMDFGLDAAVAELGA